jgi:hypothetical protein
VAQAVGVRHLGAALALALSAATLHAAKTEIKVEFDKTFAFAGVRTWAWYPDGAGEVKLALTAESDPKRIYDKVDPVLVPAIERELQARGLSKTDGYKPDLLVHYYMLATIGQTSQYMGQFLPAVPMWGLPPFSPQTQSLEVYPVGTLILDLKSPAQDHIVWRGSAQREIDLDKTPEERKGTLERAVRDLIKKIPKK